MTTFQTLADLGMSKTPTITTSTSLTRLAMSPLAQGNPGRRFSVDMGAAYVGRTDPEVRTIDEKIEDDLGRIRELLSEIGLPSEIANNFLYEAFLLKQIPPLGIIDESSSNPANTDRNILPLIPYHSDEQQVATRIEAIATRIITHLPQDEDAEENDAEDVALAITTVRNAVYRIIGENLRNVDEQPLIRTSLEDPTQRISMRQMRKIIKNLHQSIDDEVLLPEDATMELLIQIGIIPQGEAFERWPEIQKSFAKARNNALEAYEAMGKALEQGQRRAKVQGYQVHVDACSKTKTLSLFEMLNFVINTPEGAELRDLNEIQVIAYLTYYFFLVQQNPVYKKSRAILDNLRKDFEQGVFEGNEPKELVRLNYTKQGNVTREEGVAWKEFQLREMPLAGFEDMGTQRVWFDDINNKRSKSWVMKLMEDRDLDIEKLSDMARGRIVMWDITEKELDSEDMAVRERSRELLEATAKKAGKSIGLHYRNKPRKELQPGEFCVADKLDENADSEISFEFRVMKLYGITEEGVHIEFQIMPRCTFEAKESRQSPNNDRNYNLKKVLKIAKLCFVESIHPHLHEVVNRLQRWIKHSQAGLTSRLERDLAAAQKPRPKPSKKPSRKRKLKKKRRKGQKRSR